MKSGTFLSATSLDENGNPTSSFIEIDDQTEGSSDDLAGRMAARATYIHDYGLKVFGTSSRCSPKTVPKWFNRVDYQHAQRLYSRYGTVIQLSQFYGLMLVLHFSEGLLPLLVTGKSATVAKLFSRYLSTIQHVGNWYTYDPFDPASKAYRSLKVVRGYHQQVGHKMNAQTGGLASAFPREYAPEHLFISQWGMYNAQFAFMGFMAVFPRTLAFYHFTPYDFHCMFHFWRTIGYCLGVEDRFNLCAGTDEETVEHCRQLYHQVWKPRIRVGAEKRGIAMGRGIALSLARIAPLLTNYNAMLRLVAVDFDLDPAQYPLTGFTDYLAYGCLWYNYKVYQRVRLFAWLGTWSVFAIAKIAAWLEGFHLWWLGRRYSGEKYQYSVDERCPIEVAFNYRTAGQMKLN